MSREIKRRFPSDIAHPIVAGWPIYDQAIQYTGHISDSWEHGPNFNYMRSRYQEQATSRFLSRDTWTGRDGRPQSKNRYAYAEGNPASRVDPSGHAPVEPDSDEEYEVDPYADYLGNDEADEAEALLSKDPLGCNPLAIVDGCTGGGGAVGGGLPPIPPSLVQGAMLFVVNGVRIGFSSSGLMILYRSPEYFRSAMQRFTGFAGKGFDAHHIFPRIMRSEFMKRWGIDVDDPAFGAWWASTPHRAQAYAYNKEWFEWIRQHPNAPVSQVFQKGYEMAQKYGYANQLSPRYTQHMGP
jgi:RHS repeat-associated protein